MMNKNAYISAVGVYLPERILTNKDLEKIVNTSDEWIVTRTGMQERRIAKEDEYTSDMGYKAALSALEKASKNACEIDLIIVATLSPDYTFPSTACLIQKKLGAVNAAAFDIQAACSGFIYSLSIAKSFIQSGVYKNILVVAAEKISSIIDYQDRNTCVLFGDGASACVVTEEALGLEIGKISLGADGEASHLLEIPAGGCRHPASIDTITKRMHYLKMDGKEIFRHAVRQMVASLEKTLLESGLTEEDITYLVPHQANIRIIDAIAKRCNIPNERVIHSIELYGNTSAASIGIGLDKLFREKRVQDKEKLLLVAFGAGLTWGSCILTAKGDWQ